jgi:phytoene dehydrogenase-like protein
VSRPERPAATVVGGGLAGMTAALTLAGRGLPVRLLEATGALGGMAGSQVLHGRVEDHGLHIFPEWYLNVHRLVDQLGIAGNFVPTSAYHQLLPGEWPRLRAFRSLFSAADLLADLRCGVTPVADRLLFYGALVDLLSRRYGEPGRPDVGVGAFLRSRWYLTEPAVRDAEHVLVSASALPADRSSAASFRTSVAAFGRHPRVLMPADSLDAAFITPFRRRLVGAGVVVETGAEVTGVEVAGGSVRALRLRGGAEVATPGPVVLAVPHHRLAALGPAVRAAVLPAGGLDRLRSYPLGALHLHLRERLPGLPGEHVRLVGSPHAISLIDVGRVWPGLTTSVLNCVVGRTDRLTGLAPADAVATLLAELRDYLPGLAGELVEHACWQPHTDAPFFAPGVGSAEHRPTAATRLPGLHLAGDFCAVPGGLGGMEAAVCSGLLAAESVRRAAGLGGPPVELLRVRPVDPRLALAGRVAAVPLLAAARLAAAARTARQRARRTAPARQKARKEGAAEGAAEGAERGLRRSGSR